MRHLTAPPLRAVHSSALYVVGAGSYALRARPEDDGRSVASPSSAVQTCATRASVLGGGAARSRAATAPELPLHFDWIATYRALVGIVRWLQQPAIGDLSDYLLASQARTLVEELSSDLQRAGVPVGLYPARGADFWDEFTEVSRAAVRNARRAE